MDILIGFLLTLHVLVCLLLVTIVLMQLPRSEGLGAAFGGGVTEGMFGAQATNVLSKFTVWLGMAFFAITLFLAIAYTRKSAGKSALQKELMSAPIPAVAPAATPAAPAATPASDANALHESAATPMPAPSAAPLASPASPANP